MPGKHAPESPTSFYLSVARAVGGALVVLGVVALIALAAVGSNNKKTPQAKGSVASKPRTTATATKTAVPTTSATVKASATAHPVSKVTVNVLNGTSQAGLARSVGDKLTSDGYQVKKVDNCNCGTQSKTTIYYRSGEKADAQALLRAHPELGRVAPATSDIPNAGAFLTVVLGTDYPVS